MGQVFPISFIILVFCQLNVWAGEASQLFPGTRAMGMSGVFAHADDGTAIWYNPAGVIKNSPAPSDFSLEWGDTLHGTSPESGTGELELERSSGGFKSLSFYYNQIPFFPGSAKKFGVGVAILQTHRDGFFIDTPSNPVNFDPFGYVDADYYQASYMLSHLFHPRLSLGMTLDQVWADISCRSFSPCVENNPFALGYSLGLLYDLMRAQHKSLSLGLTWRSRADLEYKSTPEGSIGEQLQTYLPDRPGSVNIAMSFRLPTAFALVNTNLMVQKTAWSKVDHQNQVLSDYTRAGLGTEFIFGRERFSYALRFGVSRSLADLDSSPDIQYINLGIGIGIKQHHFLDIAAEQRQIDNFTETLQTFSLSYSYQK